MRYEASFYLCNTCGNLVASINQGGGTMVCCGNEMIKLTANTTDAAQEKHVPDVKREGTNLHVQVGSTLHPMTPEHHIGWIAVQQGDTVQIAKLDPAGAPIKDFAVAAGPITVYEWCNLHGLWSKEV